MKTPFYSLSLSALGSVLLLICSCENGSGGGFGKLYDPGYGPFDAKGNYLESEADKKAKQKRRPGFLGRPNDPVIAKTTPSSSTKTTVVKAKPVTTSTSKTTYKTKPAVVSKPKPKPTVVKSKPKPKPKPTVVKSKPKPKPAPKFAYHKVIKGDTLYSISRKHGTSVAAIQKNNTIKGTTIYLGSTLKVPK